MAQQDDPLDGLEERLQNHAKAFESLLALTPAREYYGSQIDDGLDPSEQWNRKKQTKEQKWAAKKAKLDPANQKSALDVMKEREKKRKRVLGEDVDEDEQRDSETKPDISNKKQKTEEQVDPEVRRKAIAEKRREKRIHKQEKIQAKKAKLEAKKVAIQSRNLEEEETSNGRAKEDADNESGEDDGITGEQGDMEKLDVSGLVESDRESHAEADKDAAEASSAPTSPNVQSPAFDVATNQSEASSSSSISPPSIATESEPSTATQAKTHQKAAAKAGPQLAAKTQKPPAQVTLPKFDPSLSHDIPSGTSSPKIQLPNVDQAQLQERLRKRIEELRARRKADGVDGKPARSRSELLDQRRKKEEQRKAHKKELRQQAKEEEARKREEQLRGSGSPAADIFSARSSPRPQENNFSFSRLAFEDGTAADAGLTTLNDPRRKKGPQDPKTALLAAERKQARLAGLDAAKKADIAEKDMWLNAKKRAHGERVRDDTSLLKKALKRKEKQKGKSEKEWNERKEAVVKGREMKQKKREANLQKRKEEKGGKGKKKGGKPPGGGKKKARPGFEGRFKA